MALGGLFGGSGSSPVTATKVDASSQIKDQLKAQIAQELAVANATELVNKMTENCFEQCLKAPYTNPEDVSRFD
jgi:import inner membrane translocase subunit TIM13